MQTFEFKDKIDDADHVLKYCGVSRWHLKDGIPCVRRNAFKTRKPSFSFNWLERYKTDAVSSLVKICECHTHENISKQGKFLKLKIGDIREIGRKKHIDFQICHTPHSTNTSHVSIGPSDNHSAHALFLFAEQHGILQDVPEYRNIPIEKRENC